MDIKDNFLKSLYTQHNPKTYSEVSALFELNYQKILELLPTLKEITHDSVIYHDNEQDLYLFAEERTPYTGTFILTHILALESGAINRPDIKFKVFFDAKLLEVLSVCNESTLNNSHPYLAQCSDMNIQWELNTFMEKWLDYCLDKYQGRLWQTL
ncbi:DUF1249 domain-containing protein [Bathymodiolus thermophilus thioautotrophic gill symbiont]|uniref:DUF1249 domain-containing protein n=1 Tax=Bathymodiolus thermophilus thioautotrophic gill symbiont TaxID=2360 RepID=A0A8H9CG43_9GAMM|nr:DUF1249 domain-containing protein [Bathymodiolus thermophilus thioautotrophic gill symbiont]CAB5496228.1 hypothetical protein THERMOS_460 [Bathymodiolus thermophilus thioautotrophic gill symbiont]